MLDWSNPYRVVFYANVVLDGTAKLESTPEREKFNNVAGSALFFRSHAFYQLAQAFAVPYNTITASRDLGIPIRITSDVNMPTVRSTIEETYSKILTDLSEAARLLPIMPKVKTRPSKVAAYGLLARVYLSMEDYPLALAYADSCLNLKSDLMDYNTLSAQYYPIPMFNDEVIFSSICSLIRKIGFFL
ncbi:RagB/SusD family nutrient uptake outer membrane protein [Flavobacterium sp. RHBU_24]|uniref:RagB/SusD family nutrient uptake outer membrane protein n=1 Tax=Flavobacterium sp. RHBU_24 TaxID=3391185 RepID=UPI003984FE62